MYLQIQKPITRTNAVFMYTKIDRWMGVFWKVTVCLYLVATYTQYNIISYYHNGDVYIGNKYNPTITRSGTSCRVM